MKKKLTITLLIGVLSLALAACGSSSTETFGDIGYEPPSEE